MQAKEVAAKDSEKSDSLVKPQIKLRARGTIGQVKAGRVADGEVRTSELVIDMNKERSISKL